MAAYTHEMRISQLPDEQATRFKRLYLCFRNRPCQWNMCLYHTTKLGGNRKWKLLDGCLHPWNEYMLLATRFQRLYLCFRGRPCRWDMCLYCTTELGGNRKWKIQDGGLHPWNAYISPPRLASNAIPTAIPMLSGSAIPMGHVSIPYD